MKPKEMNRSSTIIQLNSPAKGIIALIAALGLQIFIFLLFIHPRLVNWGAEPIEVNSSMPGDKYAQSISSTRAITISKPTTSVWHYIVNLGADRSGFYSYDFIEKLIGCEFDNNARYSIDTLEVGRIVSGDASDKTKFGFKVLEAKQGQSAVLENWGGFLLIPIDVHSTRLIIRTHGKKPDGVFDIFSSRIFDAMHHVMERRMLLGIKDLAENTRQFSSDKDLIWILSLFISGIAAMLLPFLAIGINRILLVTIFYTFWQIVFLVLNPIPIFGIILILLCIILLVISRKYSYKIIKF
jgi:hypothetical protein